MERWPKRFSSLRRKRKRPTWSSCVRLQLTLSTSCLASWEISCSGAPCKCCLPCLQVVEVSLRLRLRYLSKKVVLGKDLLCLLGLGKGCLVLTMVTFLLGRLENPCGSHREVILEWVGEHRVSVPLITRSLLHWEVRWLMYLLPTLKQPAHKRHLFPLNLGSLLGLRCLLTWQATMGTLSCLTALIIAWYAHRGMWIQCILFRWCRTHLKVCSLEPMVISSLGRYRGKPLHLGNLSLKKLFTFASSLTYYVTSYSFPKEKCYSAWNSSSYQLAGKVLGIWIGEGSGMLLLGKQIAFRGKNSQESYLLKNIVSLRSLLLRNAYFPLFSSRFSPYALLLKHFPWNWTYFLLGQTIGPDRRCQKLLCKHWEILPCWFLPSIGALEWKFLWWLVTLFGVITSLVFCSGVVLVISGRITLAWLRW